nr:hypothetical protein [Acidipropionibacterium acidipropionici]
MCSAKVMARRGLEVGAAVAAAESRGLRSWFATFTVRHRATDSLPDVWNAVQKGWNAVTSGRAWRRDCELFGIAGWVRVVEVTHGANGWHVHVHALFFADGRAPMEAAHGLMAGRWARGVERAGLVALDLAQEMHEVGGDGGEMAGYFTKSIYTGGRTSARSLALEMTASQWKESRQDSKGVWDLLAAAVAGDRRSLELWREWEAGSHGRRQISWAKGTRELLGLGRESTDEEITAEELGTSGDDLVHITADGWRVIREGDHIADVLTVTEKQGFSGLREFLDLLQAEYLTIDGREDDDGLEEVGRAAGDPAGGAAGRVRVCAAGDSETVGVRDAVAHFRGLPRDYRRGGCGPVHGVPRGERVSPGLRNDG